MFSAEDVQKLARLNPPENDKDVLGDVPSLLVSSAGQHFVTSKHALQEFERIVRESDQKHIPVTSVGSELELDPSLVLRFVEASPSLALLSRSNINIVTTKQRNYLEQQLQELTASQIISKESFSQQYDISLESIGALIRSERAGDKSENDVATIDGYLVSTEYQSTLSDVVDKRLNESLSNIMAVQLSSSSLPGAPPKWYISKVLEQTLQKANNADQFHVSEDTDSIICVPTESVVRKREEEVARLQEGRIPYIDLHKFFDDFKEIFTSFTDVEQHFLKLPKIDLQGPTAISETWISTFGDECSDALEMLGYADLTSKIEECFPLACHEYLIEKLEERIMVTYQQRIAQTTTPDRPLLYRTADFLLTTVRYDSERELILHSARAHASETWQQLKQNPEKDLKFQLTQILAFIPEDQRILRAVAEENKVKKAVEEQYWSEIANLESVNEAEFSVFWVERVVSRLNNYAEGVKALDDAKLRDQLSELLLDYVTKELIPESISKASSKGLLCSRKTKKNVQKLEANLQGKADFSATSMAIEKFATKQGIPKLEDASLTKWKNAQMSDIIRKMNKQSDGPTLFLTLVIALLAKHSPGVLYATGKFAPKLLKQLKHLLSAEDYEQLEKWKDLAKASSLTEEDKDRMKAMAGGFC